jgi:hypothetical protein
MQGEKVFTTVAIVKHRLQMLKVDCFAQANGAISFSFIPVNSGPAATLRPTDYRMLRQK